VNEIIAETTTLPCRPADDKNITQVEITQYTIISYQTCMTERDLLHVWKCGNTLSLVCNISSQSKNKKKKEKNKQTNKQ